MKYITTKSNQMNFSEQELEFLSNFSSIEEAINFCEAQIENFGKLSSNLLSEVLRKQAGKYATVGNRDFVTNVNKRYRQALSDAASLRKDLNIVNERLSSRAPLSPKARKELLEVKETLNSALKIQNRRADIAATANNALHDVFKKNNISFPYDSILMGRAGTYDRLKLTNDVDAGFAIDLIKNRNKWK